MSKVSSSSNEHQSYMSARMSYKPGGKKAYDAKSPLDRAKERTEAAKERADKQKEKEKAAAEKRDQEYRASMYSAQAEYERIFNYMYKQQMKELMGLGDFDETTYKVGEAAKVEEVETADAASTGGSAALKGNEKKYQSYIDKYAAKYNLDPNLVAAVIQKESTWNPNAVSSANCIGLMQVNPKYVSGNLKDPEYNIEQGCRILRECMDAYPDSLNHALTAYNRGIGGAKDHPTSGYATNVMNEYNSRKQLAQNSSSSTGSNLNYQA